MAWVGDKTVSLFTIYLLTVDCWVLLCSNINHDAWYLEFQVNDFTSYEYSFAKTNIKFVNETLHLIKERLFNCVVGCVQTYPPDYGQIRSYNRRSDQTEMSDNDQSVSSSSGAAESFPVLPVMETFLSLETKNPSRRRMMRGESSWSPISFTFSRRKCSNFQCRLEWLAWCCYH